MRDRSQPSAAWWPERLGALLAIAGVVIASLMGYHVRAWQDSGSDFKTVYASGKLFLRGVPAYNFPNIETVFRDYGVVIPWTGYAHAPTYPHFTYAALAPILALPMVPAFDSVVSLHGPRALANFLVFRQSALAALALTILLVSDLWRQARSRAFVLVPQPGCPHRSSPARGAAAGRLPGEMLS